MNKYLFCIQMNSSLFPADLTEYHVTNSVLALVDGELWPLHQPLTHSCSLTLLTFKDSDPTSVNQVLHVIYMDFRLTDNRTYNRN